MLQSYTCQTHELKADQLLAKIQQSLADNWSIETDDPLSQMCQYALFPVGKLIRPLLLLDACMMVGGSPYDVLPAAAGAEYAHVASLVHDDIIDQDHIRRGRDALHYRYGTECALLAGDTLIFQTFWALAECQKRGIPTERVAQAVKIYASVGADMCRGQTLEAQVAGDLACSMATYFRVIQLKTASLFRGAMESGAVLGGGTHEQIALLAEYGERLGILFQIVDDLLCYTGEVETMGKSPTSDLKNKRLTLPIICAYRAKDSAIQREIEEIFSNGYHDGYARMLHILRVTLAIEKAKAIAEEHAQAALATLQGFPINPSRQRLESYVHLGLDRRG
jgi:geranylgeranyl pyrophosphate synthase